MKYLVTTNIENENIASTEEFITDAKEAELHAEDLNEDKFLGSSSWEVISFADY